MNRIYSLLGICLCLLSAPYDAMAGAPRPTNLQAVLVLASSEARSSDKRLHKLQPHLRELFNFASYRHIAESRATLPPSGKVVLDLDKSYRLEVESSPADGDRIRVRVRWSDRAQVLLNTTLILTRGTPALLGGPAARRGKGRMMLVLTAT